MALKDIHTPFIIIASICCILACVGDFTFAFWLGSYFPGYSHLRETMSVLGESASPVASIISTWWVVMGFLFVLFGIGFRLAFSGKDRPAVIASWMMIVYGLGEGLGSGLFPANRVDSHLTFSYYVHNTIGGVGLLALIALPLVLLPVFERKHFRAMFRFSWFVAVAGILLFMMFTFSKLLHPSEGLFSLKGLWQRLYLVDYYIYLIVIAVMMMVGGLQKNKSADY